MTPTHEAGKVSLVAGRHNHADCHKLQSDTWCDLSCDSVREGECQVSTVVTDSYVTMHLSYSPVIA